MDNSDATDNELYLAAVSMAEAASKDDFDQVELINNSYKGHHEQLYVNLIKVAGGLLKGYSQKNQSDILKILRDKYYK